MAAPKMGQNACPNLFHFRRHVPALTQLTLVEHGGPVRLSIGSSEEDMVEND